MEFFIGFVFVASLVLIPYLVMIVASAVVTLVKFLLKKFWWDKR